MIFFKSNICINGVQEAEEGENVVKAVFGKTIAENFPKTVQRHQIIDSEIV